MINKLQVAKLRDEGLTTVQIGEIVGCCESNISYILKQIRLKGVENLTLASDKQEIVRLKKEGSTYIQICEILGCSSGTITNALRQFGLISARRKISTPVERLESRLNLDEETGCLVFQGGKKSGGYGSIGVNGVNMTTHRYAYSLYVGEIPEGMCVCHKCDNPPCCNPEHLFLGTVADNNADKTSKYRTTSKLTKEMRDQLKQLRSQGLSVREIGRQFDISESTVYVHTK